MIKQRLWLTYKRFLTQMYESLTNPLPHFSAFTETTAHPSIAPTEYEKLLDVVNTDLKLEPVVQHTLETLVASLIPGSDLLGAHLEVTGVEYEPGPRTTINTDGSLDLQLPSVIKQVKFCNVHISGTEGEHKGDVVINNLRFGDDTSVKIHLH